jgi:alanyl-tRNA synthetase
MLEQMTERLYYEDSFLYNFDAEVRAVIESPRPALILDRTAFYPTSGGQIHDTGWIVPADSAADPPGPINSKTNNAKTINAETKIRVAEVADTEDGQIVHYLDAPLSNIQPGSRVRGDIDIERRRDHMQQHSAQHVLSAAFVRLFNIPTVSFHMAEDYCSIDLDTVSLSKDQIESAERLANEIVLGNRAVDIRFVTRDEAGKLGLRKRPPAERDQLRLIDIADFDLTACGGTHVNSTGQIGAILLRKSEKVRQGYRVEFVAGQRAVTTARRDFYTLSETAALFSAHIYDAPQHARKSLDEIRSLRKQCEESQDELAAAKADALLSETAERNGHKLIVRILSDQDLNFVKLLAQKLTRHSFPVIALLATTSPQAAVVFAQTPGQPYDMGTLLKEAIAKLGGRGGGSKDFAQGGVQTSKGIEEALSAVASQISDTRK